MQVHANTDRDVTGAIVHLLLKRRSPTGITVALRSERGARPVDGRNRGAPVLASTGTFFRLASNLSAVLRAWLYSLDNKGGSRRVWIDRACNKAFGICWRSLRADSNAFEARPVCLCECYQELQVLP